MTLRILISLFLIFPALSLAEREVPILPDTYGYQLITGPDALCSPGWIDMSDANVLSLSAASTGIPADDDGAALIELPRSLQFYGRSHQRLVVSSNGYIAFADSLEQEDGGYWRNNCPLPAIPDNRRATFARIHAAQGDLERGAEGLLRWQFFQTCPRPPSSGEAIACTVVAWENWRRRNEDGLLNFQVVLYHIGHEIALQYGAMAESAASGLTIGLQDHGAASAALASCGGAQATQSDTSLCFFDPRFAAGQAVDPILSDRFSVSD